MEEKRTIIFSPPDVGEEEAEEIVKALYSGWITTGPRTKELEEKMADFCGTNRMVCLNSATACMEMTYRLFGIGEGDEVITTSYTYTATASAAYHTGAKLVMVDILGDRVYHDKEYIGHSPYEPDYDQIEARITPRTKAISAVDIGGVMCDHERIRKIAEAHRDEFSASDNKYQQALGRILVFADSAHGFGASLNGKMSGQCADFTSFSFHAVKNLTTAEGGGVTWLPLDGVDDEEIYHQYMLLSLHGQNKDALEKTQIGSWEYDIKFPGYKCNMTDLQAAIGLVQIKRYRDLLKRRREIVERYDAGINAISERLSREVPGHKALPITSLCHYTENSTSSAHLYLMRLGSLTHEERSVVITRLAEKGVPTNVHYKPLPLLTAYKSMGFDIADYPNAYAYYKNEVTLPLHTLLSDEDVDFILTSLEEVLRETV
ncbi:MAG: DegT/DnrJ/EryC1/StrS family aminotransferase [Eubacterium sp.]|nr:DegT/DnrJ/EryC1/StrS family aminotransferase [Eubacterium sp.]